MTVLSEVSFAHIEEELEEAEPQIRALGLDLDTSMLSEEDPRFRVSGTSRADGELYIVEFRCDDYREKPPFVEMVDPESGELGTKHAYPTCFHSEPCICARFNRKTYPEYSGLHSDWDLGEWADDADVERLSGMISHIFSQIHGYWDNYSGRQA